MRHTGHQTAHHGGHSGGHGGHAKGDHSPHAGHGGGHHGGGGGHHERGKIPFIFGTTEQRIPIASIPITLGQKAASVRIPKNGYLSELRFRFVGASNVTVAGSAGTPHIDLLIQQMVLSYNGGFQYRNVDGESIEIMDLVRHDGPDVVQGSANWKNYNPASATNQTIGWVMFDEVGLNTQVNGDKYLLAAQGRNADLILDIWFNPQTALVANTETTVISGTLFVEGLYLLDPPSYDYFEEPDLETVQQMLTDASFTTLTIGDNTVPIVPINGPKYLQLLLKAVFNNVPDTQGFSSSLTRFQLKINNGLARIDASPQVIFQENCIQLKRVVSGPAGATAAPLYAGWYMFDWLNDASINNAASQVQRNAIATEKIANLWLIPTIATGTTLTANNLFKLIKRAELPAVGNTNKLSPERGSSMPRQGGY